MPDKSHIPRSKSEQLSVRASYPNNLWADIDALMNAAQPSSIAVIGKFDRAIFIEYQAQKKIIGQNVELCFMNDGHTLFENSQQFDLAVVANFFEHTSKTVGVNTIGRLRDVASKQFCIALPMGKITTSSASTGPKYIEWQLNDLFALGLQRVENYQHEQQAFGLFKYKLSNYKRTPDWLNADNWANPNMWGKYFW